MTTRRRVAIAVAAIAFGLAAATGTAGPADAAERTDPYRTALMRALATCQTGSSQPDNPSAMSACVRGLAAPNPQRPFEIDLFRAFTDCLAYAADPDSLFPGIDPTEVNHCLDHWPGF